MCIIIHKPKGVKLDPIVYTNCFVRNDDGAGISYVLDNKLIIDKGINKLEKFMEKIVTLEEHELMIHFRLMSKGAVNDANCHPFEVKPELFPEYEFAICHNGTLPWRSTFEKSDTRHFVEDAMQPILDRDPFFLEQPIGRMMLGALITSQNKLCIMRHNSEAKESEVFIVNRSEGVEYEGCWFSNMSFTEEFSRYPNDADRKRLPNWKPKLWVDKTVATTNYVAPTSGRHGGYEEDFFNRNGVTKAKDGFGFDKDFGWYSRDPKYTGKRSLADFHKFKGTEIPEVKEEAFDSMDYLSKDEIKEARKVCVEIIKDAMPKFNLNASTCELAAWARAELRAMIPEMRDMSNQQLMDQMLYGDGVTE